MVTQVRSLAVTLASGLALLACGGEGVRIDGTPNGSDPSYQSAGSYRLGSGGKVLVDRSGTRIPIDRSGVTGYVDAARRSGAYLDMAGWAATADMGSAADAIVVTVGRSSVVTTKPSVLRLDLAEGYDEPGLKTAGFALSVPRSVLGCSPPRRRLRTFAIAGDAAAPLKWVADVGRLVAGAC